MKNFLKGLVIGLVCSVALGSAMAGRTGATYALPYPSVTSGTPITTTWANGTLNDIGTALTNSVSRDGAGSMTGPLALSAGSASAPSVSFDGGAEANTGIFHGGASTIAFACNGTTAVSMSPSGVAVNPPTVSGSALAVTGGAFATYAESIVASATGGGLGINAGAGSMPALTVVGGTATTEMVTGTVPGQVTLTVTSPGFADGVKITHPGGTTSYGLNVQMGTAPFNGAGILSNGGTATSGAAFLYNASTSTAPVLSVQNFNGARGAVHIYSQATPSSLTDGDLWYDSGAGALPAGIFFRVGSSTVQVGQAGITTLSYSGNPWGGSAGCPISAAQATVGGVGYFIAPRNMVVTGIAAVSTGSIQSSTVELVPSGTSSFPGTGARCTMTPSWCAASGFTQALTVGSTYSVLACGASNAVGTFSVSLTYL
jgi:hypothetical protein